MSIISKVKTMTYKDIIAIKQPVYTCLKITPHSSTRNYNSATISKMVANMYKKIEQRIKWKERKLIYQTQVKCTYIVDICKGDVSFYFLVPIQYVKLAKDKITQTWSKAKVEECEVPALYKGEVYYIKYKNKDELSLDIDKKCNDPLNNVLGVIDIMEAEDRITIIYNLMPCSSYGWATRCDKTIDAYNNGSNVRKELSGASLLINVLYIVANFLDDVLKNLFGKQANENVFAEFRAALAEHSNNVSPATKVKRKDKPIDTQVAIVSSSNDRLRASNNAVAVCEAYELLEGDNKLERARAIGCNSVDITSTKIKHIPVNRFGCSECQNLLQLPGRELLEEYHISHNNVIETTVPAELQKGVMCLGENICKESKTKAYLSTDKSYQYLTWVLIGPTRAGKTTLISNVVLDSALAGEANIVIDWMGKCQLSDSIKTALKGKVDIFEIRCDDSNNFQGLGYNELWCDDNITGFERYRCVKQQATQLITLINSLQGGDEDLRARMERYISAAALTVFMSNGPIKDVFETLYNHATRLHYLNMIPADQQERMQESIATLNELNEYAKGTKEVIGTKLNAVQGILNRADRLKQNAYMEEMLKADCKHNINLVNEIQRKGKLILIEMPEKMFATKSEKDVYATYWLTKVWCALQKRQYLIEENNAVKLNIYLDELSQVPNCELFLKSILSQMAKFWVKPIISCHYMNQITGIRDELRSANASYTLISGCDKKNYAEFKSELEPYEETDLINLKRYHALHLIKCNDGYARFVTQLPKPIN